MHAAVRSAHARVPVGFGRIKLTGAVRHAVRSVEPAGRVMREHAQSADRRRARGQRALQRIRVANANASTKTDVEATESAAHPTTEPSARHRTDKM